MNRITTICLALSLFAGTAVASPPVFTGFWSHVAIKGYDTVAYFTDSKPMKGSKEFTAQWHGAVWHFASAAHRELFLTAPERYAPQYGGFCAYAMAVSDDLVRVDPTVWSIVNDRLYLNYSRSVQSDWEARRDEFIRQADQNWPAHSKD